VTDHVNRRRRASDRAEERAIRAARHGDQAGFVVASAQAEAANRRRAEWTLDRMGIPKGLEPFD
jgi:hypothetical protein